MKRSYGYLASAVIAEGIIGYATILVKLTDTPPISIAFWRMALAIPVFLILCLPKPSFRKIPLKHIVLIMLAGIFFALDVFMMNTSLKHTSIAHFHLITSLVCFIMIPLGYFLYKTKVSKMFFVGTFVATVGIVLLLEGGDHGGVATLHGDLFAFGSLVFYSIFLMMIHSLRKKYDTLEIMFYTCCGACLFLLPVSYLSEGLALPKSPYDWMIVGLIALFGQVFGQGFFSFLLGRLSQLAISLLILASPVISVVLGYLILGEKIGWVEFIGILVILSGVYFARK
ncbi:hypothetical protein BKH43_00305 [Helicobacter sp. 13S00401-1]|uniref:DMT family transporter n=1 Tax=Helicobacter sp. 13S00401-1 TaxID=1905758 RepID=UPI000BA78DD9|nr:DMT family transporter [Helicobacter sp. 13S00401-1]PAF51719.1 hypothetical protein BKH43_00305 [Helicobacter sp. 13S00401-1]